MADRYGQSRVASTPGLGGRVPSTCVRYAEAVRKKNAAVGLTDSYSYEYVYFRGIVLGETFFRGMIRDEQPRPKTFAFWWEIDAHRTPPKTDTPLNSFFGNAIFELRCQRVQRMGHSGLQGCCCCCCFYYCCCYCRHANTSRD